MCPPSISHSCLSTSSPHLLFNPLSTSLRCSWMFRLEWSLAKYWYCCIAGTSHIQYQYLARDFFVISHHAIDINILVHPTSESALTDQSVWSVEFLCESPETSMKTALGRKAYWNFQPDSICRFPKIGVPPNQPLKWEFPLQTIYFGVPPCMESPYVSFSIHFCSKPQ